MLLTVQPHQRCYIKLHRVRAVPRWKSSGFACTRPPYYKKKKKKKKKDYRKLLLLFWTKFLHQTPTDQSKSQNRGLEEWLKW
jgi:hypothetical protein